MKSIKVQWGAWYQEEELSLQVPEGWRVHICPMKGPFNLSEEKIKWSFSNPIGSKRISELARGRKRAVIAVDDLTRPTPAYRLLPFIINELEEANIKKESITIVMAFGAHRAMTRGDLEKKLGREIVDTIAVYNHVPYENLVCIGKSSQGSSIYVNKTFAEADFKIGLGFIMPHPTAGFGGGGKIVLPGVCGIETLVHSHRPAHAGKTGALLEVKKNQFRQEIEEIARKAGLDIIVNAVGSSPEEMAGVFVGDMVDAHREGVKLAQEVYSTEISFSEVDIAITNCYPVDIDIIQMPKALDVFSKRQENLIREKGAIVITTAASEGRGFHSLADKGMRVFQTIDQFTHYGKIIHNKRVFIFSQNFSLWDIKDHFPQATLLKKWEDIVQVLEKNYGDHPTVAVFPTAPLQIIRKD